MMALKSIFKMPQCGICLVIISLPPPRPHNIFPIGNIKTKFDKYCAPLRECDYACSMCYYTNVQNSQFPLPKQNSCCLVNYNNIYSQINFYYINKVKIMRSLVSFLYINFKANLNSLF